MRLTRTFNAGHDNLYLNKDDVNRLLKGQMLKESSLIVQMENPEREWVGLTDEEKAQFVVAYYPSNWDRKTAVSLMSDYEKYLKERNT